MKFGPREIVFVIVMMLIPVGAWWFVFHPQDAYNKQMLRQTEARQAKLRQLEETVGAMGDLNEQIDSLTQALGYFRSKLPSEKEIDKILQDIWRLAESNNLHAKSIRLVDRRGRFNFVTAESDQAEQPIAIHLKGDFEGFYSFLLDLENQSRIMRIKKVSVERLKDSPSGHVDAKFEMSIFFDRNRKEIS